MFFTPKKYLFSNNTLSPVVVFWLGNLKGKGKAADVDRLRLNTMRGTKTVLLKGTMSTPVLFILEFPSSPQGKRNGEILIIVEVLQ